MLAVQHITSEAIQSLQNSCPNQSTKDTDRSFTIAKGITKDAKRKSDTASDTKKRLESLRRLESVRMAIQTSKFPRIATAIRRVIKLPSITFSTISRSELSKDVSMLLRKFDIARVIFVLPLYLFYVVY